MDLDNRLSNVNSLSNYIEFTQQLERQHDVEIVVNTSIISSMKKIQRYEIEFFNKYGSRGAAFRIMELMLESSLKSWKLLGPELIGLVQYWLNAVRKHFMSNHTQWWSFLKKLLELIREIYVKELSLNNTFIERIGECLLDLATSGKPDVSQIYEIIFTFNIICNGASREVRMAVMQKFGQYFVRISTILARCGFLPCQLLALETLLRWVIPRDLPEVRRRAADRWLQPHLYTRAAIYMFVNRDWQDFFRDARDFLNCHNETTNSVTSVVCKKLTVGDTVIVDGTEKYEWYLDVNCGGGCVSVTLIPEMLTLVGVPSARTHEPLTVTKHAASEVTITRVNAEIVMTLRMTSPPSILPSKEASSDVTRPGAGDVTAVLSSRVDLPRLDAALRTVFGDKYKMLLEVNIASDPTPPRTNSVNATARLSHPAVRGKRKLHSGCMTFSRGWSALHSPSSASTTSLAQLHDKLVKLPPYEFLKEPVSVAAQPELSTVSEKSESEISHSLASADTLKLRRCAQVTLRSCDYKRKTQSDCEGTTTEYVVVKPKSQSDNECANRPSGLQVSSLFIATLGTADKSVINKTIERMPKDKDINTDNLIELLVQEALNSQSKEDKLADSGINVEDPKKISEETRSSEVIEETQNIGLKNPANKNSKSVFKSTSDESNTEKEPNFVSVRKRNQRRRCVKTTDKANAFDVQAEEDFFSQHFSENQMCDIVISPALVKNINKTSSESSECLLTDLKRDFNIQNEEMPNKEVVECLSSVLDRVCFDFDECAEIIEKKSPATDILNVANDEVVTPLKNVSNTIEAAKKSINAKAPKRTHAKDKPKQVMKLKFGKKPKAPKNTKGKLKLEPVKKMSIIPEATNESDANKTSTDSKKDSTDNDADAPLVRRKRKLYSPKDDQTAFAKTTQNVTQPTIPTPIVNTTPKTRRTNIQNEEKNYSDKNTKKEIVITPKSAATCYVVIENDRQILKRERSKPNKNKETPPSPKTCKMNEDFEKLKSSIVNKEKIMIADKKSGKDIAVFNFTSDSDDEDFIQKKIEIQKRTSTTTLSSNTSVKSTTRRRRAVKKTSYAEDGKSSSNEVNTNIPPKRKRVTKLKNSKRDSKKRENKVDKPILIDERMRDAVPDNLDTSFIAPKADKVAENFEPMIQAPEIEAIPDDNSKQAVEGKKMKGAVEKKESKHNIKPLKIIKDNDKTISPLPGLLIELEKGKSDCEETVTTNLEQKLQKIYKEGPKAYNDSIHDLLNSQQFNITNEFSRMEDDNLKESIERTKKSSDTDVNTIDDTINSEIGTKVIRTDGSKSKKSKLTLKGKTPIVIVERLIEYKDKTHRDSDKDTKNSREKRDKEKKHIKNNYDIRSSQKSKVIKSSTEEIICLDTPLSQTRSKSKISEVDLTVEGTNIRSMAKSSSQSDIEVIDVANDDSERSIATDGITGHGNIDESPPSAKLFKELFIPREILDMEQTMKKYYLELNDKVNASEDSSESQVKNDSRANKFNSLESETSSLVKRSQGNKKMLKEHDYNNFKWMASVRETGSENSSEKSSKSPVVSLTRLSKEDLKKWLPTTKTNPQSNLENIEHSQRDRRILTINRKSQISPINVDDLIPKIYHDIEVSKDGTQSSDLPRTRFTFPRPTHQSSPMSKRSSCSRKRTSAMPNVVETKKKKITMEESASQQSSYVEEWLKNIFRSSKECNVEAAYEVLLQNLIEKLDTTLTEMHHNTTKHFIGLFVESQRKLDEISAERRASEERLKSELRAAIKHIISTDTELKERAIQRENEYSSWLKRRFSEVLTRDKHQKSAMVVILREDVAAVQTYLRGLRTNTD